jgi:hypothetical protein
MMFCYVLGISESFHWGAPTWFGNIWSYGVEAIDY